MIMPLKIQAEGGLILQRPEEGDADGMVETILFSFPVLSRWTVWFKPDYSPDDARAWIRQAENEWVEGTRYSYLIRRPQEQKILGLVTVNKIEKLNLVGNLGYWIHSDYAGKGIVTRAARALVDEVFNHARLRRIEVIMAVDNIRSRKVAENLGAVQEAVLKDRIRTPSGQADGCMYALFPESHRD